MLLALLLVLKVGCQILIVVSADAEARREMPFAGGAKATAVTAFVCPRRVFSCAPVSQSHTRSVPSSDPLTSFLFSYTSVVVITFVISVVGFGGGLQT